MNSKDFCRAALVCCLGFSTSSTRAQIAVPSDGSDGALNITATTRIDLGQAVSGAWNADNSANSGKGVYDSNVWAVVFKYTSVNIASNTFVTFTNHSSRAPVVWLVSGDVTISGDLSLDGQSVGNNAPQLAEGGPGGFRGGAGFFANGVSQGAGFGPAGGEPGGGNFGDWATGGGYATVGEATPGTAYGNPSLLPLVGGSGGGGYYSQGQGGAGGGGAILIACAGTLTINGTVHANGGNCLVDARGGGGSGGGIRLVATTLAGAGSVQAIPVPKSGHPGGVGRVRIERAANNATWAIAPDPSVVPLQATDTPLIWLPTTGPMATIVSINSVASPADPKASFGAYGPDVTVPQTNAATVVVQTVNAESASQVMVRVTPRTSGYYTEVPALLSQTNSLSPLTLLWTATNVPVNLGYSAVIARVIRP